ncbi:MAG: 3-isopropylmalate dehydrogenase, partial [Chloroflexi bacterium]|nr:3-isopropylmalate dehydrogenase [Chloroflexota bacterium]
MQFEIVALLGDGVGPEVATEAIKVLETVGKKFGHTFKFHYGLVGGAAIDAIGVALADETLQMCKGCDAVLLGAVGGPKWDDPQAKVRPEDGLLALRKELGLFANL